MASGPSGQPAQIYASMILNPIFNELAYDELWNDGRNDVGHGRNGLLCNCRDSSGFGRAGEISVFPLKALHVVISIVETAVDITLRLCSGFL